MKLVKHTNYAALVHTTIFAKSLQGIIFSLCKAHASRLIENEASGCIVYCAFFKQDACGKVLKTGSPPVMPGYACKL